ncbi:hypothetical protein [Aeoliella mucimassa]|uniref:PEP-CTERM protein-sorting domain-containing protein n=1 Tax=Aeoliella mucimassa TaxID=2527972 RepID=A0A518AR83_9BACT|nr:hypothetical protein [Aeoliella mucimassa]QDU57239.1 hypothetical protein Pan181_34530 [Aeoliella mucimassa]
MKKTTFQVTRKLIASCLLTGVASLFLPSESQAISLISPGDPVLAIDLDISTGSEVREAQLADFMLDGDTYTKMLNRGGDNAGFIVTPSTASVVQSFTMTTANDSESRDPASYLLYGTNDPITSVEASNGREEDWTLIVSGDLTLPSDRETLSSPISFTNSNSYSSYKMVWPTIKGSGSLTQVAEIGFFTSVDATGDNLLAYGDPIISIRDVDYVYESRTGSSDGTQEAAEAIDQDVTTKYLNFGKENTGLIVTPSVGMSIVDSFQLTTANDASDRDPSSWVLYGTNDPITSEYNTDGSLEDWVLIDSGDIELPNDRGALGPLVSVDNSEGAFTSYRLVFPTLRNSGGANSMQIAEIQLFGSQVPEPSSVVLGLGVLASLVVVGRLKKG